MSELSGVAPVPVGRTARRLEWQFLPPHVRSLIEERCGSPVVDADSQGAGFTPGFASVLTCEDGSRHFVKAASAKAQRMFAESYREEARKLGALPDDVPAPRLLWVARRTTGWCSASSTSRRGRRAGRGGRPTSTPPSTRSRPWPTQLTPAPDGLELDTFAEEFAELAGVLGPRRRGPARPAPPRRRPPRWPPASPRSTRRRHRRPHRRPRRQHAARRPTAGR